MFMYYKEAPCTEVLGEVIECEWSLKTTEMGSLVHPDGCADLLFDEFGEIWLSGLFRNSRFSNPRMGLALRGFRLKPGAIWSFFGIPASALVNQVASVADLSLPLARAIRTRARQADTQDELVRATVQLLLHASSNKSCERRLSIAVRQLESKSLPAIAASLGITERQMHRLFMREVGIGPSRLKRIYRLQRTIDAMRRARTSDLSMASFALDQGFSDQAHMNHDVKDLTGLTPSELLRSVAQQ